MSDLRQTMVLDLGTSSVKVGYANEFVPQMIIPSYLASDLQPNSDGTLNPTSLEDLTSIIGEEAKSSSKSSIAFMGHGMIQKFDYFSLFSTQLPAVCGFDSRKTPIIITDPIYNLPSTRERIGELFFDVLDCPALAIQSQPICSIVSNIHQNKSRNISGLVVDCGDGSLQITPVYEGYPIISQSVQIPLAGKDITFYLTNILRSREKIPSNAAFEIAQKYKENYCYVSSDSMKEFAKFDNDPSHFSEVSIRASDGKIHKFQSGHEKFMSAEAFFHPDIFNESFKKPLSESIVETVYKCPIDTRRALFSNINISGGSTMFKNFDKRLEKEIKSILRDRVEANFKLTGNRSQVPEICIPKDRHQKYRVFAGAAVLGRDDIFANIAVTRSMYEENGPSIFRKSQEISF